MKLGVIRKILKDDLKGGDIPGWVGGFLEVLNDFIEKVGIALQGKLTFQDNFSCRVHTQKIVSGTEYKIATQSNLRVSGVQVLDVGGRTLTATKWARGANNTITLTLTYTGASDAECAILILLG